MNLRVSITGHIRTSSHVEYTINSAVGGLLYSVQRRYTEFMTLHDTMVAVGLSTPFKVPKLLFHGSTALGRRVMQLESFVRSLVDSLSDQDLPEELAVFLGIPWDRGGSTGVRPISEQNDEQVRVVEAKAAVAMAQQAELHAAALAAASEESAWLQSELSAATTALAAAEQVAAEAKQASTASMEQSASQAAKEAESHAAALAAASEESARLQSELSAATTALAAAEQAAAEAKQTAAEASNDWSAQVASKDTSHAAALAAASEESARLQSELSAATTALAAAEQAAAEAKQTAATLMEQSASQAASKDTSHAAALAAASEESARLQSELSTATTALAAAEQAAAESKHATAVAALAAAAAASENGAAHAAALAAALEENARLRAELAQFHASLATAQQLAAVAAQPPGDAGAADPNAAAAGAADADAADADADDTQDLASEPDWLSSAASTTVQHFGMRRSFAAGARHLSASDLLPGVPELTASDYTDGSESAPRDGETEVSDGGSAPSSGHRRQSGDASGKVTRLRSLSTFRERRDSYLMADGMRGYLLKKPVIQLSSDGQRQGNVWKNLNQVSACDGDGDCVRSHSLPRPLRAPAFSMPISLSTAMPTASTCPLDANYLCSKDLSAQTHTHALTCVT